MTIKNFAEQLSEAMLAVEDAKVVIKSVVEAAKEQGINIRALKKVAREMIADSAKLAKQYADEEQLDLFRAEVGIFARKGLDGTDKAAAAGKVVLRKRADTALRELDGMLGTNIAADQKDLQRRVNKYVAGKAAE